MMEINTSIICAGDGSKSLLSGRIPNLQLANETINLMSFESKIDTNGWQVIFDKVTIAEPKEERRFAHSLISDDDHLESVVVLLNHVFLILNLTKFISKIRCKCYLAGT